MSYEIVLKNTKRIESILDQMGAKGKGLYEKSLSIEEQLDNKILKSIKFIASIRNQLLHEEKFQLTEKIKSDFIKESLKIINAIDTKKSNNKQGYCEVTNESLHDKPYMRDISVNDSSKINIYNIEKREPSSVSILFAILIIVFISVKAITYFSQWYNK